MNNIAGNNIKILREANSFTQNQVAEFLGINRSTYSNYELGTREVPLELLEKISNLFGCELNVLFEEDKNIVEEILTSSFRVEGLSEGDMCEIASFKNLVINYLKMKRLLGQ